MFGSCGARCHEAPALRVRARAWITPPGRDDRLPGDRAELPGRGVPARARSCAGGGCALHDAAAPPHFANTPSAAFIALSDASSTLARVGVAGGWQTHPPAPEWRGRG